MYGNSYPFAMYNKKTKEVSPLVGAGGGGSGSGGIDPGLVEIGAQAAVSGKPLKIPGLRGGAALAFSTAVNKRAKEIDSTYNPATAQANFDAAGSELKEATKQQGQQAVLELKAAKDVDLLREEMHGIPDFGSKWATKTVRDLMAQGQNTQIGRYATQLYTTAQGISQAIANNRNATEGQRHEAGDLLNPADSIDVMANKLQILMRDVENSGKATKQRVQNAKAAIAAKPGAADEEAPAAPSDSAAHDAAETWLNDPKNKSKPGYAAAKAAFDRARGMLGSVGSM
jgi:hypothetical protein